MNEKPLFFPPHDGQGHYNDSRRERDTMAYLALIIGPTGREDGGPGLDTIEGWCYRVRKLVQSLGYKCGEPPKHCRPPSMHEDTGGDPT